MDDGLEYLRQAVNVAADLNHDRPMQLTTLRRKPYLYWTGPRIAITRVNLNLARGYCIHRLRPGSSQKAA